MKVAVQPWPIDRSDPDAKVGKICVVRAFLLRPGRLSWPVWVACIVSLLGKRTVMPDAVGRTCETGTVVWM